MRTVFSLGTTIYGPKKCQNGYTILTSYLRKDIKSKARIFQSQSKGKNNKSQEKNKPLPCWYN